MLGPILRLWTGWLVDAIRTASMVGPDETVLRIPDGLLDGGVPAGTLAELVAAADAGDPASWASSLTALSEQTADANAESAHATAVVQRDSMIVGLLEVSDPDVARVCAWLGIIKSANGDNRLYQIDWDRVLALIAHPLDAAEDVINSIVGGLDTDRPFAAAATLLRLLLARFGILLELPDDHSLRFATGPDHSTGIISSRAAWADAVETGFDVTDALGRSRAALVARVKDSDPLAARSSVTLEVAADADVDFLRFSVGGWQVALDTADSTVQRVNVAAHRTGGGSLSQGWTANASSKASDLRLTLMKTTGNSAWSFKNSDVTVEFGQRAWYLRLVSIAIADATSDAADIGIEVGAAILGSRVSIGTRGIGGGLLDSLFPSELETRADALIGFATGLGIQGSLAVSSPALPNVSPQSIAKALSRHPRGRATATEPSSQPPVDGTSPVRRPPPEGRLLLAVEESGTSATATSRSVVSVDRLRIEVRAATEPLRIRADAFVDLAIHIGPISFFVADVGAWAGWWSAADNQAQMDGGIYEPLGFGFEVSVDPIVGGAFLERQEGAGGYAGVFIGAVADYSLSGLAAVDTAGASPAVLVVGCVALPEPIQLGLGVELRRLGAVVGLNRRIDLDAMRRGVASGVIGAMLSDDVVAHASQILPTLIGFFPAQAGTYVLGPVVRVGWLRFGSGMLVEADLALAIELPSFARVAIFGSARIQIPDVPDLMRIRVDLAGGVDFSKGLAAIDASLIDSHVFGLFRVTGDLAFRALWLERPAILLSLGGFHPSYTPEIAGIPQMKRLALAPAKKIAVELHAEAYLAITSNTFQAGGKLDARLGAGGILITGMLQIDTLVQFAPFHFDLAFDARLAVEVEGISLVALRVHGRIAGPAQLVIAAGLEIDLFLFSIEFSHTFRLGEEVKQDQPKLDPSSVLAALVASITRPEAIRAAIDADPHVELRLRTGSNAVVSPKAGVVEIVQRRLPLGVDISKLEGAAVEKNRFDVSRTNATGDSPATDWFSPAEFASIETEAQRLALPSFEQQKAGLRVTLDVEDAPGGTLGCLDRDVIAIPGTIMLATFEGVSSNYLALTGARSGAPVAAEKPPRIAVLDEAFGNDGTSSALAAVHTGSASRYAPIPTLSSI